MDMRSRCSRCIASETLLCTSRLILALTSVCGNTAGQTPVQTMMPAVDKTFPIKKEKSQDFLVGRLDQNVPNRELH